MEINRLEKLEESIGILKEKYLSLIAERDGYLKETGALAEAEGRVVALEAEREDLRAKVDSLIVLIDGLTAGDRS